jgi:hypothetical protein
VRISLFLTYSFSTISYVVLHLLSGFYNEVINDDGTTEGEAILIRFGFTIDGEP